MEWKNLASATDLSEGIYIFIFEYTKDKDKSWYMPNIKTSIVFFRKSSPEIWFKREFWIEDNPYKDTNFWNCHFSPGVEAYYPTAQAHEIWYSKIMPPPFLDYRQFSSPKFRAISNDKRVAVFRRDKYKCRNCNNPLQLMIQYNYVLTIFTHFHLAEQIISITFKHCARNVIKQRVIIFMTENNYDEACFLGIEETAKRLNKYAQRAGINMQIDKEYKIECDLTIEGHIHDVESLRDEI